ncbi:MAG: recombinase family protein [Luteimonas sp.]|nr:recombinase family protein [Luteimonas sp.]
MTLLKRRCAVYTRKSSDEGLDQAFNSLDAQREACEAYVQSQKAEGWVLVPHRYDDGGFSGGNLDRPALKRLVADIEAGLVDVVVVYKIDRLSRSLMDFARLVELFERCRVTFVSVTQSFNTTTSMGRLVLNVLLSFAQFEREIAGERIRDKIAASRRKGLWMGGVVPLGYRVEARKLVIDPDGAEVVRFIFRRFVQLGSGTAVLREVWDRGWRSRRGRRICKVMLHKILRNRVYLGEAVHKGVAYPGEHEAIVSNSLWDKVQAVLAGSPNVRAGRTRAQTPALLKGLIFGPDGRAMSPTHTRRGDKLYRYYVSQAVIKGGVNDSPVARLAAGEVEAAVVDQIRALLRSPEVVVATWRSARQEIEALTEAEVRDALARFDPLWDELFPTEQARIIQLLIDRIHVVDQGIDVRLRVDGLASIFRDLAAQQLRAA